MPPAQATIIYYILRIIYYTLVLYCIVFIIIIIAKFIEYLISLFNRQKKTSLGKVKRLEKVPSY